MSVGVLEKVRYNKRTTYTDMQERHLYLDFCPFLQVNDCQDLFIHLALASFGCPDRWTFFWIFLLGRRMPETGVMFRCLNRIHMDLYFSVY